MYVTKPLPRQPKSVKAFQSLHDVMQDLRRRRQVAPTARYTRTNPERKHMQDNTRLVRLLNERDDFLAKWRRGRMSKSAASQLSNLEFDITAEVARMNQEQRTTNPLRSGGTRASIGANIAELIRAGHPRRQAIAIAFAEARRTSPYARRRYTPRNPKERTMRRIRRNSPISSTQAAALVGVLRAHGYAVNPRRSGRRNCGTRSNPRVTIHGTRGRVVAKFTAGTKNRRRLARKLGKTTFSKLVARGRRLAQKFGFQKYSAARLAKLRVKARRGWAIWRRRQLAKRR